MVKRVLIAGHGFNSWLQQRLSALVMLVAIIICVILFALAGSTVNSSIISWQQYFSYTIVKIVAQLTVLAVVLHAWIGMRDIVMDYVKCHFARITLYTAIILWLGGSTIYSFHVLWH